MVKNFKGNISLKYLNPRKYAPYIAFKEKGTGRFAKMFTASLVKEEGLGNAAEALLGSSNLKVAAGLAIPLAAEYLLPKLLDHDSENATEPKTESVANSPNVIDLEEFKNRNIA